MSVDAEKNIGDGARDRETEQGWQPMATAPKGRTVEVKLRSRQVLEAHFAQDLSGEEQPPFSGWFRRVSKNSCGAIETPIAWRPLPEHADESAQRPGSARPDDGPAS